MTIQAINIGTVANDGNGDAPRQAGEKINANFTDANNAASKLVGTSTGELPTADDLSMVGAPINYTGNNLNPNAFGGKANAVVEQAFARDGTRLRFKLVHSNNGVTSGATVVGTFSVVTTQFGAVRSGIPASDFSVVNSSGRAIYLSIANMTGLALSTPYLILSDNASSTITVT